MAGKLHKTVILNVVGLTPGLIGDATPRLSAWRARGKMAAIRAVLPAVTCAAQATYLTGVFPDAHGIVGNGWYFREECEIKFWRQSNRLVQAPKIWEAARRIDPSFTCANFFWWYNMYSSADWSMTPRPIYPADGRKIPDLYTAPATLRFEIQRHLGPFPLFDFWGPKTSIRSSRWIADAAVWSDLKYDPALTLIYLPHLDYNLQRLGPRHPAIRSDLLEIDAVCGDLIRHYEGCGAGVIVLSEYGIAPVSRPVNINRILREAGLVAVREELGRELLDPGASAAFAVADHQIAHVYINDPAQSGKVRRILERTAGIEAVWGEAEKKVRRLDHPRSGELIAFSDADAWFTYYYWLDDRKAPDFARTVDIHRKPGYDPVELFIDPTLSFPKVQIGLTLLKRALGFRTLLNLIPLDPSLVKGSHGRAASRSDEGPLFMTRRADLL
ncbi:MAG TPA: nucleotide pyrophosphatase/phosphodiesterase family protein, partial [Candidatus Manganitrophaceae bacterium]|nr:nucleotide pyrophosphatase/phosphodiesterase family protein [Candidatus Manganitrophaceae bacterium]